MSQTQIEHAVSWFEIPVSNLERSTAFYEQLLGVRLTRVHCSGETLAVFPGDETHSVRGALLEAGHVSPQVDGVTIYLNAGDRLQPALDRLQACGGTLLKPMTVLPDQQGCYAHVSDPDGQRIGLFAPA